MYWREPCWCFAFCVGLSYLMMVIREVPQSIVAMYDTELECAKDYVERYHRRVTSYDNLGIVMYGGRKVLVKDMVSAFPDSLVSAYDSVGDFVNNYIALYADSLEEK